MNLSDRALKQTVQASTRRLGATMFYARHEVYGGQCCHFEALDREEQQVWIDRAVEFLKTIAPGPPEGVNDSLRIVPSALDYLRLRIKNDQRTSGDAA